MYIICLFLFYSESESHWPISCILLSVCKCCIYVCSDLSRIFYYVSVLHVVYRFVQTDLEYSTMCLYCMLYIGSFSLISCIVIYIIMLLCSCPNGPAHVIFFNKKVSKGFKVSKLRLWGPRSELGSNTLSNSPITGNHPVVSARRHVLIFPPYKKIYVLYTCIYIVPK